MKITKTEAAAIKAALAELEREEYEAGVIALDELRTVAQEVTAANPGVSAEHVAGVLYSRISPSDRLLGAARRLAASEGSSIVPALEALVTESAPVDAAGDEQRAEQVGV